MWTYQYLPSRSPRRWPVLGFALAVLLVGSACRTEQEPAFDRLTGQLLLQGTEALRQHDFRAALALADSALKQAPDGPDKANAYFYRARVLSEVGRFEEAGADYHKVLEQVPDYRGVWNNLGNNTYRQQAYYRAIDYYQKELAAHLAPIPLRGMGRAYVELGLVDSARAAFEQAIALDSLYSPAYFNLALLFEDEGHSEEALRNAQKALSLDSGNLDYQYLVGSYLVRLGRGEAARGYLQAVVAARPWQPGALYNLGQAMVLLGRTDEAQKYLDQAEAMRAQQAKIDHLENTVRALPDDPLSHAGLGFALRRVGRYNDAMHAYQVALQLDPNNLEILNNTASLCLIRGDTTLAINYFHTILQIQPTFVDAWLNLGIVYAMLNEPEAARQAWQMALRYEPNHPMAKAYLAKISGRP